MTATVTLLLLAAGHSGASAGDGAGRVDCAQARLPECDVRANIPDRPGRAPTDEGGTDGGTVSGPPPRCHYERVPVQEPPPPGAGPGAWHLQVCVSADGIASQSQPRWLTDGQAQDPRLLGELAVSRLRLPAPQIRTSPDPALGPVLVWVPVWAWIGPSTWGSRSATAAVSGVAVTAVAYARRAAWRFGDGASPTICGPGTEWTPDRDAAAPSPTCGHTYQKAGRMTVTATVTWQVVWYGAGQSGTVPDLTVTSTMVVQVVQAPTANTTGQR
ncbi:hypothetical protein [Phytohabitans aurantiacus]|uniref:hypothetical protein n=1 Tax=Phytohabitans aurantiacus TaxID=3016789 RepID=UPI002492F500|nr:hypothetical protein [Phytohabitans aurantiacus]